MKVLVADDDLVARMVLRAFLTRLGFDVYEAGDGDEAYAHMSGPDPSRLAILDWVMPGLTGTQLCTRLKSQRHGLSPYIILLTAKGERKDVVAGLEAGADDFMVKPYDPCELQARIDVGKRIVQLQQELIDLNSRLEERVQERTLEVERLLTSQRELTLRLAHDLKTPLTPMLSLLPLLNEPQPEASRQEILELVTSGAQSIHTTVMRILELCQLGAEARDFGFCAVSLHTAAQDAIAGTQAEARAGFRQISNCVPEPLLVRADASRLRQALRHLLDNAIEFTPADGRIIVDAVRANQELIVSVTDTGAGIAAEHLSHLFEPYYKTDSARRHHGAPGLGLTIARTIVSGHGGKIWAESAGLNRGTTIRFTLPIAEPTEVR